MRTAFFKLVAKTIHLQHGSRKPRWLSSDNLGHQGITLRSGMLLDSTTIDAPFLTKNAAKAEVRLASAQLALSEFDEQRRRQFNIEEILHAAAVETECPVRRRNQAAEMLQLIMAAEIAARSQRPLLARYLREAQSRRRRALHAWLAVPQSGNHRNEARLQPEDEFMGRQR